MKVKEIFKSINPSENILSKINAVVDIVETYESDYRSLTDNELKKKTKYFVKRLELGESIGDVLPEALAVAREAAYRMHGIFAYRVQLIGSLIIYEGNFAEMKTGEGKTLTIALSSYIIALEKKNVHVITVNEYLVKRDAEFCRKILNFLGMTVGFNTNSMSKEIKKKMFECNVTYTTNSELVFDYLKDNLTKNKDLLVIPDFNFCIIDEGDSILIDEASTPLIISQTHDEETDDYLTADAVVKQLAPDDYTVDWEIKTVVLKSSGILKIERMLNIECFYAFEHSSLINKIHNALIANFVFNNGNEYIVGDNKIYIVDQYTGRLLKDRSYNNGLHQAIQVKEYLKIEPENKIGAKITYQSFFRQYKKIGSLSGTGVSESKEFQEIYNMIVVKVPTNKPIKRLDLPDIIFGNRNSKINNIVDEIKKHYLFGQPLLVGTSSVSESETIYQRLQEEGIACEILNARNHDREAQIIKKAGQKHAITIATNIAGRGVDIKLDDEAKSLGGLYVIGCEKNESKRVDDQLRGRSGRQGDPGKSIFFISLEDNIFKRFGKDKFEKLSKKLRDEYFDSKFLSKTITGIQNRIQSANFDSRKNLIEYNELLFRQQNVVYKQRKWILKNKDNVWLVKKMIQKNIDNIINRFFEKKFNPTEFMEYINGVYFYYPIFSKKDFVNKKSQEVKCLLEDLFFKALELKMEKLHFINFHQLLTEVIAENIDRGWQNYLEISEKIKIGINLRSLEQRSPLNIYVEKLEKLFNQFLYNVQETITQNVFQLSNSPINEECYQYTLEWKKNNGWD